MQSFYPTESGSSEITIFDKRTRCWHPSAIHPFEIFLLGDDMLLRKIYTQFDNLFGKHAETTVLQYSPMCPKRFLPIHLNIVRSRFRSFHYAFDSKELEDYFESIPQQEFIEMNMSRLNCPLNPDSKFFRAKRLVWFFSEENTEHLIEHFKGTDIVCLLNSEFQFERIIEQLKKWKSRKAHLGLEKLHIERLISFDFHTFNSGKFEKELNMKKLPPSIRPPVVKLTQMSDLSPAEITIPTYITRNDGIVAFLSVAFGMIVLSVRKFTEKEMLERNCIE